MKTLFGLCIFLAALSVNAQVTFQKTFHLPDSRLANGGDYLPFPDAVWSDDSTLLLISAYTDTVLVKSNSHLCRMDLNGNIIWEKLLEKCAYGTLAGNLSGNGRIYLQHRKDSSGYYFFGVMQLDSLGNWNWTKRGIGLSLFNISSHGGFVDDQGRYVALLEGGDPNLHSVLIVMDSLGQIVKNRYYTSITGINHSVKIIPTHDGNYLHLSYIYMSPYILKLDSGLNIIWQSRITGWAGGNAVLFQDVIETTAHDYLFAGFTGNSNYRDIVIYKLDSAGQLKWARSYGDTAIRKFEMVNAVLETHDHQYVVCGEVRNEFTGKANALVMKLDTSGLILWSNLYGDTADLTRQVFYDVFQLADEGYLLSGKKSEGDYNFGNYLVRTDSSGNSGCEQVAFALPVTAHTPIYHNGIAGIDSSGLSLVPTVATIFPDTNLVSLFCQPLAVHESLVWDEPVIFPNPSGDQFTIRLPESYTGFVELAVYELSGRKVLQEEFATGVIFTFGNDLPAGFYIVCLKGGHQVISMKLIKRGVW